MGLLMATKCPITWLVVVVNVVFCGGQHEHGTGVVDEDGGVAVADGSSAAVVKAARSIDGSPGLKAR